MQEQWIQVLLYTINLSLYHEAQVIRNEKGDKEGSEGAGSEVWDQRNNRSRQGSEVMSEGQWSVRNIRAIGGSGDCWSEGEKGGKGDIIAIPYGFGLQSCSRSESYVHNR